MKNLSAYQNFKTTTDVLRAAEGLLRAAKLVSCRDEHATWWDVKVLVLRTANEALESGAFTGDARNELLEAKHIIDKAEVHAGAYSAY